MGNGKVSTIGSRGTVNRIIQARALRDPVHGETAKARKIGGIQAEVIKKEIQKNPQNMPQVQSIALIRQIAAWKHKSADGQLHIGAQYGNASRGEVWPDNKGNLRLILFIDRATGVWFIMKNRLYTQTWEGFAADVGYKNVYFRTKAGMAVVVKLITYEILFVEGFLCGMSRAAMIAVMGRDISKFVVDNRKNFPKWQAAANLFWLGRKMLKTHAPTLYDILFSVVAWDFVKRVATAGPSTITGKDAAKMVGQLTGGIYKAGVSGTYITLKIYMKLLLREFVKLQIKTGLKSAPRQYKDPAQLVKVLKQIKKDISPAAVQKIKEEYKKNPITIQMGLNYLLQAIDILSTFMLSRPKPGAKVVKPL